MLKQIRENFQISVPVGYGLVTHCYQLKKNLVPKNTVFSCTISDYLGMVLIGQKAPLVHASMNTSMGFFDNKSNVFQKGMLKTLQVGAKILSEVASELSILDYYRKIPATVVLVDSETSFFGTAGLNENTVLLNMGTGG